MCSAIGSRFQLSPGEGQKGHRLDSLAEEEEAEVTEVEWPEAGGAGLNGKWKLYGMLKMCMMPGRKGTSSQPVD